MLPQKRAAATANVGEIARHARPVGRKKLVCATLSINCMTPAASSGGNASNSKNAVTNCAHPKNGNRIQVMPRRAAIG